MKIRTRAVPNRLLRQQRERHHWTQTELAQMIGATYLSVCRWESGATVPSLYYRKRLCDVFGLPPEALGLAPAHGAAEVAEHAPQAPASASPQVWQVPFRRNPFFTGREQVLERLAVLLGAGKAAALSQTQALSGLGGVGKTQTAVEYAYRHRQDYQAVFWARAESRATLQADLVNAAMLLDLPERQDQDQNRILAAVQRWLSTHDKWLLILDNVEEVALVEEAIPVGVQGHLLLTTRAQSLEGIARRLEVEQMTPEEGALFLLRRADLLAPDAPLEASPSAAVALEISRLLDGLPLALDQAGAYIEETGCSPADYLERYQRYQAPLLERRGRRAQEHPHSVSTTFALAFEQVQRANPAAADLLRLCAFLAPDAIPEELIATAVAEADSPLQPLAADPLALDEAYAALRRASLVRRNAESKMLTIHRLVQAVLKEGMDKQTQRLWAERAVRLVNRAFPEPELEDWSRCQALLSHALICASLIANHQFCFPDAAHLLRHAGWYQRQRGQFAPAQQLLQQALALYEQMGETALLDVALTLNNLAAVSWYQGHYTLAEQFCRRALTIWEQVLGPQHPQTASGYNGLGILAWSQGHYAEAAAMYQRAVAILEQALGPDHPRLADALGNLATAYQALGDYRQAESLLLRALSIGEQQAGPEHPVITSHLNDLGELYRVQGRYEEAEPLFQRALAICERAYDADYPGIAHALNNLAEVYLAQGRCEEAEPLLQRALVIREHSLGVNHQLTAHTLDDLGQLAERRGHYTQALDLYQRALTIYEQALGPEHPDTVAVREGYTRLREKLEGSETVPGAQGTQA
jgi:tetratricopeptide (TPR) repeat protein/DNA-binding XRE family transcriptional regulator